LATSHFTYPLKSVVNCTLYNPQTLIKTGFIYRCSSSSENERYPEIRSIEQLISHITLVGIKVPYAEMYGGRSIGLSFDCTWDDENGIGVRLNDERVIKIGFQDVAL